MSEYILSQADQGTSLKVRPGDTIVVRLPEIPSTGYRWTIAALDSSIVSFVASDIAGTQSRGIGGGGERRLTFRAVAAGTTSIQLKRWREWEGDNSITDRYSVTITVQNDL